MCRETSLYYYRIKSDQTICLLRVYGDSPRVEIPAQISGMTVNEIGSYCFSSSCKMHEAEASSNLTGEEKERARQYLHEQAGRYIEEVVLPDTIEIVNSCAFIHCTNLTMISVPGTIVGYGSDSFMNCSRLHRIIYRHPADRRGSLKALLGQINWDVEVEIVDSSVESGMNPAPSEVTARLFYPEYAEGYDEIGPAHIFATYIHGEGYRARQSFRDEAVYFTYYDQVFPFACVGESEKTLVRMAWNRLAFPCELSRKNRAMYEAYIRENASYAAKELIAGQEMVRECRHWIIEKLICSGCLDRKTVEEMILMASDQGDAELSASLIDWKGRYYPEEKKSRYAFDDMDW